MHALERVFISSKLMQCEEESRGNMKRKAYFLFSV